MQLIKFQSNVDELMNNSPSNKSELDYLPDEEQRSTSV